MKTNFLICPGEACPLRLICRRFQEWINNEDDDAGEIAAVFNPKTGTCDFYEQIEFYGC